ncbi:hypothetical protein N7G274_002616 [Stereocaulon virgatum]|uniref:Heterokaryon incompatibility domain-containing protein n=1 Tax=Stereocaulon virgatum TaxID=373712 RepID=A0ABR4AJ03_9LECA
MTMESYMYSGLDGEKQIRVLHLLPGPFTSDVHIKLQTVELSTADAPQYEALSYVWGSKEDPAKIAVTDGIDHVLKALSITRNLAEALPYLRDIKKTRTLWIDAICIDQFNLEERSKQVSKMGDVYRLANRVLVWLGPETPNSNRAMRLLNTLSAQVKVDWATRTISSAPGTDNRWRITVADFDCNKDIIHAVERLLASQWFERLWVWPEIRLANDSALVLQGYDTILWQDMLTATYVLRGTLALHRHSHLQKRLQNVAMIGIPLGDGLETLANITRCCKCEDPRDRIFALRSLLPKEQTGVIKPDYTKSVGETYWRSMISYVVELESLDILGLCNLSDDSGGLPTWVVDWSKLSMNRTIQMRTPSAGGNSSCEANVMGTDVLEVVGAQCSTITRVGPSFDAGVTGADHGQKLSRLMSLDPHKPYVGGGDMLGAYCRTFVLDDAIANNYVPPLKQGLKLEEARNAVLEIVSCNRGSSGALSRNAVNYLYHSERLLEDYVFFTTETGHFGVSLAKPKVYDQVVALLGCRSLMLLRPTNCGYSVVGRCYVQGFMDAEALLGPLPGEWRRVLRLHDGSQVWYPAFAQETTGKVQATDPRLGPLPAGWRLKVHELEDYWNWYVPSDTRQDHVEISKDPRMTSKELKLREVDMKTFRLV